MVQPAPTPVSIKKLKTRRISANGASQNDILFNRGNAISIAFK
jgi:hypothetical protein